MECCKQVARVIQLLKEEKLPGQLAELDDLFGTFLQMSPGQFSNSSWSFHPRDVHPSWNHHGKPPVPIFVCLAANEDLRIHHYAFAVKHGLQQTAAAIFEKRLCTKSEVYTSTFDCPRLSEHLLNRYVDGVLVFTGVRARSKFNQPTSATYPRLDQTWLDVVSSSICASFSLAMIWMHGHDEWAKCWAHNCKCDEATSEIKKSTSVMFLPFPELWQTGQNPSTLIAISLFRRDFSFARLPDSDQSARKNAKSCQLFESPIELAEIFKAQIRDDTYRGNRDRFDRILMTCALLALDVAEATEWMKVRTLAPVNSTCPKNISYPI